MADTPWPAGEEGGIGFEVANDTDDEWALKGPARGVRLALPAIGTLIVVFVAAGFWAGATLEKNRKGSAGGSAAAALAARFGRTGTTGGAAGGGFPLGGGAASSSSGTTGTISVVDGRTLYILTSAGALVQVTLSPSTTITRNAQAKSADLRPGDTITAQGKTTANGNVTATSVTATGRGVTSSTGGFGLGGGRAPTAPSTASGTTTKSAGG